MYKAILRFFSGLYQLLVKFVKTSFESLTTINNKGEINCVLIHAFSQGSLLAFRRIYDHYAPPIYRVAKRYLASGQLAEELLAQVFSTFWLERAKFSESEPEKVRYYLFKMTENVAIKLLEKHFRKMLPVKLNQEK